MDLSALMLSRIDMMLKNVGPGMKVLLMDSDTTTSVSLSCSQSEIMKREVYLFEYIHAPSSASEKKNSLAFLKCVILVRPDSNNIRLLAKELAAPRYGSYFVYFTDRVKKSELKQLAEADSFEVVADIKELPSDFLVMDSHVFVTSGVVHPMKNLQWNPANDGLAFNRCFHGLKSLLLAQNVLRPNIVYMKHSMLCEQLATSLFKEFSGTDPSNSSGKQDPILLILDRRLDPVTPILNQWTYQAMIHELIGIKNNTVDLSGRPDVPDDLRQVSMSASNDEFYRYNMYSNFGEIGQTIKTLVQNFQKKAKSHSNIESIGDIKDFVASYPEFKKMSGTVSKHVGLVGELSKEVKENCLLDVSECEQNIVCGLEKEIPLTKLQQVLGLPKIAPKDALRLVALYTIRYGKEVEKNLDLICRSVKGLPKKEVYDLIQQITKFSRVRSTALFEDKSNPFTANFIQSLRGTDNVYTQHRPFLAKEILPDLIKGRMRNDLEYIGGVVDGGSRPIIVFVIGGITYEETRSVHLVNKEFGSNVVIGGTSILNFDLFLEELKISSSTNQQ